MINQQMSGASRVVATLESLKEHQKRMLELGLAIKNLLDSPGNIGRSPHVSTLLEGWNEPKHLQPHLNNLEATLKAGLNVRIVYASYGCVYHALDCCTVDLMTFNVCVYVFVRFVSLRK